ncbi:MAG: hypothetical protein M3R55_03470 [Acidobacteriota bacterium]|nr:hypothetical protein [Acidobacteriota bacterium]
MQCRFGDLAVDSAIPLAGLPAADGPADIRIVDRPLPGASWAALHEWSSDEGEQWLAIEMGAPGYRLTFPELTCVVSHDGTEITVDAAALPADAPLTHLLLHQILPLAVSRGGRMVLHACAVETPHGAIGLLGPSGAGKSTLTAAFCRRGAALVADDALLIDMRGGAATAWPTADGIRLWDDMREVIPGSAPHASVEAPRKRRIAARIAASAMPLVRLFVVGDTAVAGARVRVMTPAETRLSVLSHLFRIDIADPGESRRLFDLAHAFAAAVPARHLAYPDGIAHLDGAVDAVLQDVA